MNTKIILSFLLIIFSITACNTTEPPPDGQGINLKLEDVSCTEAWIELTTANLQLPTTITLKQTNPTGDTKSHILNLTSKDSLLYIDSLLPNKSYQYQVSSIQYQVSSNELSVTTMDTTSHNFTWQTWTFGEHSSSVLRDVAIINENNIIAVGEIYMNDSLGQPDPHAYNAAHWNGNEWKLFRVMFYAGCSNPTIMVPYPASSIIVFNENDIWISMYGDQVARLDGMTQVETHCMPVSFSINKIWGTSSNDLYAVGSNGTIVRYNGTLWWRMGVLTNLTIYDIWGEQTYNGEYQILCIASNSDIFVDSSKVLKIEKTLKEINNEGLPVFISSIWFIPERKYFIAGDGLYNTNKLGLRWLRDYTMPPYYKTCIRGKDINDIVMVGAFGLLMHFNGFSWKSYNSLPYFSGAYGEVEIKGNLIACTGGLNDGQAIITLGRR